MTNLFQDCRVQLTRVVEFSKAAMAGVAEQIIASQKQGLVPKMTALSDGIWQKTYFDALKTRNVRALTTCLRNLSGRFQLSARVKRTRPIAISAGTSFCLCQSDPRESGVAPGKRVLSLNNISKIKIVHPKCGVR